MGDLLDSFREIWTADFEFQSYPGEKPIPVCLVARELRTDRTIRLWQDQFGSNPPYPTDKDSLFIAYLASAELGCHLALGWPIPVRILDLYVEFKAIASKGSPLGYKLIGALFYYGLDSITAAEKMEMIELVLRGGPWTAEEQRAILDYCQSDVDALSRLLPAMIPSIDLPRAIYRGRYMATSARMEYEGVPIDIPLYKRICAGWEGIQDKLIAAIDTDYQVFEGRTFKQDRFAQWLAGNQIPWPFLESGRLDLEDDTFRQMAKLYSQISPLRELRHALSDMRLNELAVGNDGRNRCLLSPFRAKTSRNAPSNTKFIFGPSVWLRFLIQPPPDWGIAYIDWEQQEIGIAAALSGDQNLMQAYVSGDCYLWFAKQVGAVPENATKESHPEVRENFKQCLLGVNYGMGKFGLAKRTNQLPIVARQLLELHKVVFRQFWKWSDSVVDYAMFYGVQSTVFNWKHYVFPSCDQNTPSSESEAKKKRKRGLAIGSLRNFPMQGNGAEMLRLACCLGTENGIRICAPVHDAVLIMAPTRELATDIERMRGYMAEASRTVLAGFELRMEAKPVFHPNHYSDPRGETMFAKVMSLL
jgi:DNA polymerase family A